MLIPRERGYMNDYFQTKDLSEAAFLYTSGQKLIGLDRNDIKIYFVFQDGEECEKLVSSFWSKEARVNAKDYSDGIRTLKALIFKQ